LGIAELKGIGRGGNQRIAKRASDTLSRGEDRPAESDRTGYVVVSNPGVVRGNHYHVQDILLEGGKNET